MARAGRRRYARKSPAEPYTEVVVVQPARARRVPRHKEYATTKGSPRSFCATAGSLANTPLDNKADSSEVSSIIGLCEHDGLWIG